MKTRLFTPTDRFFGGCAMRIVLGIRRTRVLLTTLGVAMLFTASAAGQTLAPTKDAGDRERSERSCGTKTQARDLTAVFSFDPSTGRFPEGIAISQTGA